MQGPRYNDDSQEDHDLKRAIASLGAVEVCPHGCGEDRCHFDGPACDGTQFRVPTGQLCGYCFPPSKEEDHEPYGERVPLTFLQENQG